MEENNFTQPTDENLLSVSRYAAPYLRETSKWTFFLSILGFVFTGIIIFMALFASSIFSTAMQSQAFNMPQGFSFIFGFIYFLIGLLYFFPSLYLYKYSRKLKLALTTKNSNELLTAFENEKSFFKFWGILSIVGISFYVLILAFAFLVSGFH